ncbi:hypothetical protein KY329_02785 [Candidatus Woesearchaeota archaeon]|nr:hypothetical protein [Candidatus Woesearchaeota archaeon]
MKLKIFLAIIAIVLLSGCIIQQPLDSVNETGNQTEKAVEKEAPPAPEKVVNETQADNDDEKEGLPVKEVTEGALVEFPNLKAVDPDGDPIAYTFTSPLDKQGKWQTDAGDAGEYVVTVTASDGKNTAQQDVLIVVRPKNLPPTIQIGDKLVFEEGETVKLEPTVTDPDGDNVTVKYFGWMNSNTKETTFKDAGTYKVTIEATDGISTVSKEITVGISNVNRPPKLKEIGDITVKEGELVEIAPEATDPDGDTVTYEFELPLDKVGKWQTEIGDAGEHAVKIVASDGRAEDVAVVNIIVEPKNRPPTIEIQDVDVKEGETVTLSPVVSDPEGDEFTVKYEGWMTSNTRETSYEDSGTHTVTIIAEDTGGHKTEEAVVVKVEDVNRAPIFGAGAFS